MALVLNVAYAFNLGKPEIEREDHKAKHGHCRCSQIRAQNFRILTTSNVKLIPLFYLYL